MPRAFVVAALSFLAVALPAAQAREPSGLPSLRPLVAAGAPGAILLTRHGSATVSRALGSGLRAGDSFRIGSLTKTYVAAVVLQLAGQGRLSVNDPVERYLPGVVPGAGEITIARFPTRCGVAWGHNGDTPGYVVYALTSRDGRRQAVLLVNEDAESLPHGTGRVFVDVLTRADCGTQR
jgi:hypothetical protein